MTEKTLVIKNVEEIDEKARDFLSLAGHNRLFAFYGEMGAGKTTFIKGLCKHLQVTDEVTSPTFSIVNEYETGNDFRVFHFDFYRIKKEEEIYDFGYEEYLYGNDYCLIEWPEMAESLIPENTLKVNITINDAGSRVLKFRPNP